MKKILIISLVFISLCSCRAVKKEWVKETFAEKSSVKQSLTAQDSTLKSEVYKLETFISLIETSVALNETINESTSENESTTVSGSLTAEDGKEKSVTFGGTTIKSNGANVTFETSSTKEFTRQFESILEELSIKFEKQTEINKALQTEINSLKSENAIINSELNRLRELSSKEVDKSGLSFGTYLTIFLILLAVGVVWYFKKSIPFLNKL